MKKTGQESLTYKGASIGINLLEFWKWAYSDLLSNAHRGVFAEFIVAQAIGSQTPARIEWASFDLSTSKGLKIEVKSSAYVQSWKQNKASNIQFSIGPTREWRMESNSYSEAIQRQADVYVFCLLDQTDRDMVDPLNLDQWKFYVLETRILNERCFAQKSISLSSLLALTPHICCYHELRPTLEKIEATFYPHSAVSNSVQL